MKLNKFLYIGIVSLLAVATACEDDGVPATNTLAKPDPVEIATAVNSLTFEWDRVDGATQYGYELTDPAGKTVKTGVTNFCEETITGLKPSTTYTLTVWAYGVAYGNSKQSPLAVITATTAATAPLEAITGLTATVVDNEMDIKWDAVHNAISYSFILSAANTDTIRGTLDSSLADEALSEALQSGRTEVTLSSYTAPEIIFTNLKHIPYTLKVVAVSDKAEYTPSDTAVVTFTPTAEELWINAGTMTSRLLGEDYTATLTAYADGQYCLSSWYGVSGDDLWFLLGTDGEVIPYGDYNEVLPGVFAIPTGVSSLPSVNISTLSGKQSFCKCTKDDGGTITFNTTGYDGMDDTFSYDANYYELYRVDGTFHLSANNTDYNATLVVNSNGYCVLEHWCGVQGVNVEFTVDDRGDVTGFLNGYPGYGSTSSMYECLYTGISGYGYMYLYYGGYSWMLGNAKHGSLCFSTWFSSALGYTDDYFIWGGGSAEPTAQDLVGTYYYRSSGWAWYSSQWNWFVDDDTYDVTLTDDGKLVFDGLYYSGSPIKGTFNPDDMTITFEPQIIGTYYTLSSKSGAEQPFVATVSEDLTTIIFDNWKGLYGSSLSNYFSGTYTIFATYPIPDND